MVAAVDHRWSVLCQPSQGLIRQRVYRGRFASHNISDKGLHITRRVYRGVIDTPKSTRGTRVAALSASLVADLNEWRTLSLNTNPDDWIFPSENHKNPVWPTSGTTKSVQHSRHATASG